MSGPSNLLYINKIHRDATVCRCLFTAKLLYTFRVSIVPINGLNQTVTEASGTGHSVRATTFRQRDLQATLAEGCCSDLYQRLHLQFYSVMDEMEPLEFHLVHDTGWQQHRWTISEAVNTVKCS